jgi:(1->4)-alpha-D-glucan 1-alpha-D-glucosylmutase
MSIPRATARLQLHKDFTLDDAAAVVDYYAALGVSHIYTSPILTARPGSTHGYDVVDPTRINPELGGEAALRRFVQKLRAAGLGLIIDIVPNHMGVGGSDNPWWLHVLEWGRHSLYARWFDIDWNSPDPTLHGKILLPFLGDPYAQSLRSGDLRLHFCEETGQLYFGYFTHRFPLAPETYGRVLRHGGAELRAVSTGFPDIDPSAKDACDLHAERLTLLRNIAQAEGREAIALALSAFVPDTPENVARMHRLLERQNYKLTWWRNAAEEINWRRFFEVSDLAGVRVELDDVFAATHETIFRLYMEGLIDGVRIDHVDGLADPTAYCQRLRATLEQLAPQRPPDLPDTEPYIIVEKILTHGETLRHDWPIAGTTGYDFMDQVGALLHCPDGLATLNKLWVELASDNDSFPVHVANARRQLLRENFVGEFAALTRAVHAVARTEIETRDISQAAINRVLIELLVAFPIYRTYWSEQGRSAADLAVIERTVNEARRNLPPQDQPLLDTLIELFDTNNIDPDATEDAPALRRFAVRRFEQLTPPLAAKAVEDTVFYRYGRLLSRNEVGADPDYFSSPIEDFHAFNLRHAANFPHTMLATATHDHKRGEDVRARLAVLSECADDWSEAVRRWVRLHGDLRQRLENEDGGDALVAPALGDEMMLYQMIVGAWPLELQADDAEGLARYADRLAQWQQKSLREAKLYSSWAAPNEQYEQACRQFLEALFDRSRNASFLDEAAEWMRCIAPASIANGLTQTLLRLTSPGMPDLYQGTEFWDLSLVDPDNRRPVDYAARHSALQAGAALHRDWRQHQLKQGLIHKVLALRAAHPSLFAEGEYVPLLAEGPLADHVIAFLREHEGKTLMVAVLRFNLTLVDEQLALKTEGAPAATRILLPRDLPPQTMDVLRDRHCDIGAQLDIRELFGDFPVALLMSS